MSTVTVLILTCAVLVCIPVVTSTEPEAGPVLPIIGLRDPLMTPDMACLFICEMCFWNNPQMSMFCSNTACSHTHCNVVDLVYIGRACNNTKLLDKYVSPTMNTDTYSQQETYSQEASNQ